MDQEPARARVIVTMNLSITRCGCGDPSTHPGVVCPTPRTTDEIGEVGRSEATL